MNNPDPRFSEKPFSNRQDYRFIYWSRSHVMVVGVLNDAVEASGGLTVLHGVRGTGKSMLLRRFVADVLSDRPIRYHRYPFEDDLQWSVERALNPPATRGPETMLTLRRTATTDTPPVLIVDQAQHAPDGPVEDLLELAEAKKISLVLVREHDFAEREAAFSETLAVRYCELEPLGQIETEEYMRHRLTVAGGNAELFSPTALKRIQALTLGIPRNINALCNLCLLNYPKEREISAALVDSIAATARERGVFPRFLRRPEEDESERFTKRFARKRHDRLPSAIAGTLTIPDGRAAQPPSISPGRGTKTIVFKTDEEPPAGEPAPHRIRQSAQLALGLVRRRLSARPPSNMALGMAALVAIGTVASASPYLAAVFGTGGTTAAALRVSPLTTAEVTLHDQGYLLGPFARAEAFSPREVDEVSEPQGSKKTDLAARSDPRPPSLPARPDKPAEEDPERALAAVDLERMKSGERPLTVREWPAPARKPAFGERATDAVRVEQPKVAALKPPGPASDIEEEKDPIMVQTEAINLIARTLRDFTGWDGASKSAEPEDEPEPTSRVAARTPSEAGSSSAVPGVQNATPVTSRKATRLVIHHSAADRQRARLLVTPLRRRGFEPELRTVSHSISKDHVRYFSRGDIARARQVVGVLAGHDMPADLRDFSNQQLDLDYSLLEVWLSN